MVNSSKRYFNPEYQKTQPTQHMGQLFNIDTGPPPEQGRAWEWEFFGFTVINDVAPTYLDFEHALKEVVLGRKELLNQVGWNPSSPNPKFLGGRLFKPVRAHLTQELGKRLRFYPAVGTALDWYHGVDGVFFLSDHRLPLERYRPVSIDLSTVRKTDFKSDILLYKDSFWCEIGKVAAHIANTSYHNWKALARQYK